MVAAGSNAAVDHTFAPHFELRLFQLVNERGTRGILTVPRAELIAELRRRLASAILDRPQGFRDSAEVNRYLEEMFEKLEIPVTKNGEMWTVRPPAPPK